MASNCWNLKTVSATEAKKESLQNGNRVMLPASILNQLITRGLPFPYYFCLTNRENNRSTHCGILSFEAEGTQVIVPDQVQDTLGITDQVTINVSLATLPNAKHICLRPHQYAFTQLDNPKAVLENGLTNYGVLNRDEIITVRHLDKTYKFDIVKVSSSDGDCQSVSITGDLDVNLEFEEALDAPKHQAPAATPEPKMEFINPINPNIAAKRAAKYAQTTCEPKQSPFRGTGRSMSGTVEQANSQTSESNPASFGANILRKMLMGSMGGNPKDPSGDNSTDSDPRGSIPKSSYMLNSGSKSVSDPSKKLQHFQGSGRTLD